MVNKHKSSAFSRLMMYLISLVFRVNEILLDLT